MIADWLKLFDLPLLMKNDILLIWVKFKKKKKGFFQFLNFSNKYSYQMSQTKLNKTKISLQTILFNFGSFHFTDKTEIHCKSDNSKSFGIKSIWKRRFWSLIVVFLSFALENQNKHYFYWKTRESTLKVFYWKTKPFG